MNGEFLSLETAEKIHNININADKMQKMRLEKEFYEYLYNLEYDKRKKIEKELEKEKTYHEKYTRLCEKIRELKSKRQV